MRYVSTRNRNEEVSLSEALERGLASDSGLFIPKRVPKINWKDLPLTRLFSTDSLFVLAPFFAGDQLENQLKEICQRAFTFPVLVRTLGEQLGLLELFHGPTFAFKDFGARFLSESLSVISQRSTLKHRSILVATSGDTGGAVAAAFWRKRNFRVILLYPEGRVSQRQEKQLTCWGENVKSFAVNGTFDDCQRMVKEIFSQPELCALLGAASANSINIGRLLPQITYFALFSIYHYLDHQTMPTWIVPTGNMGHAVAAFYAQKMGFPIQEVVISTNENSILVDFLSGQSWQPRRALSTLANAMDVGHPSNWERLLALFDFDEEMVRKRVRACSVHDEEIRKTMKEIDQRYQIAICPHTATALFASQKMAIEGSAIAVATAHPAKFEVVDEILGRRVEVPLSFQDLLRRPSYVQRIEVCVDDLLDHLDL